MRPITRALISAISWYQRNISAGRPRRCRYMPTCSQYSIDALRVHGVFKGTLLSVWRILRCNPWSKGGVDRVPAQGRWPGRPLGLDELLALYEREDKEKLASEGHSGHCDGC
ncbi:MAG: membrane protein insertion efficiency factor YidD [Ancrocorticia sp.]|jgi:putative membrane protein insertion efficiency factor|nr:membrane protein insertion efficiency factor YidD [Ancrocorticia sp.]MCI1932839.1 membrane protein insertion efficiency factor YidD [Ancrocorticia sp.]MCI1963635.1 membrane protein insertion efficiency factor YidD [Ancrocorticia sp.]MCI2002776.1 membrane protein insertion efficiency factor YidD [Ancrocorticia sp.]MCI2012096.1 membrane protein insertion efficiency factor YidD [Ancrocorticia sp.]